MTVPGPGLGPVAALAFKATVDDLARFRSANGVGAHLGLTLRWCQFKETNVCGRKCHSGDAFTRAALFTAAHLMLTRWRRRMVIRGLGKRIAQRSNLKLNRITVVRSLSEIMDRMWRDESPFCLKAAA